MSVTSHINLYCTICQEIFDNKKDNIIVGCFHRFHLKCLSGLVNTKCPNCRKNMVLPKSISEKIKENYIEYEKYIEQEERNDIISNIHEQNKEELRKQIKSEVKETLKFLCKKIGVMRFIPTQVLVNYKKVYGDSKIHYKKGVIMKILVEHVLENIEYSLSRNYEDDDCDEYHQEDYENENPFKEENETLIQNNIKIVVIL